MPDTLSKACTRVEHIFIDMQTRLTHWKYYFIWKWVFDLDIDFLEIFCYFVYEIYIYWNLLVLKWKFSLEHCLLSVRSFEVTFWSSCLYLPALIKVIYIYQKKNICLIAAFKGYVYIFIFQSKKDIKKYGKCFLFHLKCSFR